jgi:glucuronate isomerase
MIKLDKPFLSDDFLLETDTAIALFRESASRMPIIDYHNHLSPKDIADNRSFQNITEAWLEGDHYKWRAMRAYGIDERYCTGNANPREKFLKWAETVPQTLRNPLYHWTHLELKNYFGITRLLNPVTAEDIFEECQELLQKNEFRVQGLLQLMNVEVVCTTDDPCHSLEHHARAIDGLKLFPTFRPDKVYQFASVSAWNAYIDDLGEVAQSEVSTLTDLIQALQKRVDFFAQHQCRASDHGLEFLPYTHGSEAEASRLFGLLRSGKSISVEHQLQLRTFILLQLSEMYHEKKWAQQFHLGALRNNNSRYLNQLGADTGFDSIGDFPQAATMARFFDELDNRNKLTKTIIYNLNPACNELFASMIGNFNDGTVPGGKMQYGAAWWFLDQKDGMEKQLNALSNLGLLSQFVGMVTDSRSFLSFPRHEYFRRTLCNLLGREMERGELPDDMDLVAEMVKNICYHNTKRYFSF